MELKGYLTVDDWGSQGRRSTAAALFCTSQSYQIQEQGHYSELWFNPNPGRRLRKDQYFERLLMRHPDFRQKAEVPLQFVIKEGAEALCDERPDIYQSREHRPKLIVALKAFEMLCGIRPVEDIKFFLLAVPELKILIPLEIQEDFLAEPSMLHLRDLVLYWLTATDYQMRLSLEMFFDRMAKEDLDEQDVYNIDLMKRIHEEYPFNPGVFAPLFLNHICLNRNQAVYIKPGLIHTYISGDILEISGKEGIPVFLALTYKDFVHLPEGVHYMDLNTYRPEDLIFPTESMNESITKYMPPVWEFSVDRVEVQKDVIFTLPQHALSSAFFISKGIADCYLRPTLASKRTLTAGSAIFLLPYERFSFIAKENVCLFHIYPNIECFTTSYMSFFLFFFY